MGHFRTTERNHVISFVKITTDNDADFSGRVLDLSPTGVRFRCKDKLEPNLNLKFSVMVPNINYRRKIVTFDASIMWSTESEEEGYYECGIKIESIGTKDLAIIEQYIKDDSHRNRWIEISECFAQEH